MASLLDAVVPGAGSLASALAAIHRLCADMKEGEDACSRLAGRLQDVVGELQRMEAQGQRPPSQALDKYVRVVAAYLQYLQRYAGKSLVARVVRHRKMMDELVVVQEEVVALFRMLNLAAVAAMMQWKSEWDADRAEQQRALTAMAENDALVLRELQTARAQTEAVMLLRFEMEKRAEQQTRETMSVMRSMTATVVRATHSVVKALPPWYIPTHEIEYEPIPFAQGSFGSVHRGVWGAGTRVVVKCLLIADAQMDERTQQRVESEISIWYKLNNHPNIIKMFGASHVSAPPFIVCEEASGGNLGSYFARNEANKRQMWRLLYQAALGLDHVHKNRVVHGDLKLNNILVGADGLAKLSDFGLSAVRSGATLSLSSSSSSITSGGLRWRAPECLRRRPTFASDVYSFAMCIFEAFLGEPPFAFLDDETVREAIRDGEIPERPDEMDDDAWNLIVAMTPKDPAQRCSLGAALEKLKILAEKEEGAERAWSGMAVSKTCGTCFWEISDGLSFCAQCGARVGDDPILPELEEEAGSADLESDRECHSNSSFMKTILSESLIDKTPTSTLITVIETATETANLHRALLILSRRDKDEYWNDAQNVIEGTRVLGNLAQSKRDYPTRLIAVDCMIGLLQNDGFWKTVDLPTQEECSTLLQWFFESDEKREWAATALSILCMRSENQVSFAQAGAIDILVHLLRFGKVGQSELFLAALYELAASNEANCSAIISGGGVPLFMKFLQSGSDAEKENAILAIGYVGSQDRDGANTFVKAGAVEPLMKLLRSGTNGQKENAAFALANIAEKSRDCCLSMVKLGAVQLLVTLVRTGTEKQKEWSAAALGKIAFNSKTVGDEIVQLGGMKLLVELLRSGTDNQKSNAASALAFSHNAFQDEIAKAGAIPLLVAMLHSGTDHQKISACSALAALADNNNTYKHTITYEGASPFLISLLRSKDGMVVKGAAQLIAKLVERNRHIGATLVQDGVGPVLESLQQSDATSEDAKQWVLLALSYLRISGAIRAP